MSRAPYVLTKPERAFPAGDQLLVSTTLGWRLVNPAMPGQWTVPLGEGAELIADKYAITRVAQDLHAYSSHTRAASAWADGLYAAEVVPVAGVDLARDETVRPEASLEAMDRLKPVSARTGRSPPATPRRSTTE